MSMHDEARAFSVGRQLYRETMGTDPSPKTIHEALITSGLPVTLDMLGEINNGFEAARLEASCGGTDE